MIFLIDIVDALVDGMRSSRTDATNTSLNTTFGEPPQLILISWGRQVVWASITRYGNPAPACLACPYSSDDISRAEYRNYRKLISKSK